MVLLVKKHFLLLLSLLIAIVVFFKNFWLSEDAYIIFRSLEQLFAGNGPIWNPHERVQVSTSPLWYYVLAVSRVFSSEIYLNVLVVSFALWLSTVLVLKRIFKQHIILLISILLLTASNAFFDFTSSGLENVLAYYFIAIYILNYLKLFDFDNNDPDSSVKLIKSIRVALFLFGLIICIRHDLIFLILPSIAYVICKNHKIVSLRQWCVFVFLALLPFGLYSLFSLIYYGFPFPNTAYAKLNTGIPKVALFHQGIDYFISSFRLDTLTPLVIMAALVIKQPKKHFNYLVYGVILSLCYVAYIGGDFMQGRFLSYAYMVSVILLLLNYQKLKVEKLKWAALIVIYCYCAFYTHTPLNSGLKAPFNSAIPTYNSNSANGIADEREFYFNYSSFYKYLTRENKNQIFPMSAWSLEAIEFKKGPYLVTMKGSIGLFGYFTGTDKIIIDYLALSDPLLARLPAVKPWRIGHFVRNLPEGYAESVASDSSVIVNPKLNEYYKKLKIVTQDKKLFSIERLKTIFLFNIGYYDYLLDDK